MGSADKEKRPGCCLAGEMAQMPGRYLVMSDGDHRLLVELGSPLKVAGSWGVKGFTPVTPEYVTLAHGYFHLKTLEKQQS